MREKAAEQARRKKNVSDRTQKKKLSDTEVNELPEVDQQSKNIIQTRSGKFKVK